MSVLVKGMKMPKCCSDCACNYDQMACCITGTKWWSDTMLLLDFDPFKDKLCDCPLVELPEKHGRLKDVDALVPDICHDWEDCGYLRDDGYSAYCIEKAPTVIEAEGER